MNISPGACQSGSQFFEFSFWGNLTHLWIPYWERRDLVTVPRQSGRIHACAQNGRGHHARKPGYRRRNRAACERLFNPCWCNKSYFSSRILVYLYTEAFVKCNFILLMYSGKGKPHSQKGACEMMMGRYPSSCCGHFKANWLIRTSARYSFRFHIQVVVQDKRFLSAWA